MTDKTDDAPNEILSAVKEAKAHGVATKKPRAKGTSWPLAKIGLAAGIGSAAIAGAVLFAGRDTGRGKDDK